MKTAQQLDSWKRPENPAFPLSIRVILHIGFLLTGVVTVLLGPVLPALSAKWSLPDARAGLLFTAQFIGATMGVALSARIPGRGFLGSLLAGYVAMALGIATLGVGEWQVGFAAVLCFGLGLGMVIPPTNLWVAEANPERRAAAVSVINLVWGIGAVACGPLVSVIAARAGLGVFLWTLAGAIGLLTVAIAAIARRVDRQPAKNPEQVATQPCVARRKQLAVVLGALFFLYVGTENSFGGWAAAYAKRVSHAPEAIWVLAPSFFWAALLLGRTAAPLVLRRISENGLLFIGLALAGVGDLILLFAGNMRALAVGNGLAGLGCAAIYPILIAWLSHGFGARARRTGTVMFSLANLGGATLPWTVGVISSRVGSLAAGLAIPLVSIVLMLALVVSGRGLFPSNPRVAR
ncbi:MAG TPA: MFS transporter [Candidatus Dormibacteraeota bacterium]|nr:MFS transporter [Candidatus Dormibacteraeota bacterium]